MTKPVVITLEQVHLDYCRKTSARRQENAEVYDLPPHNGAPNDHVSALALHDVGIYGECAGKLYLNPVKWNAFRSGRDFVEADLEDWIDVKTRRKHWHSLIVQFDDDSSWAYVLACAHDLPRMHLIGWCWGHEAKQERFIADPAGGRPAYFINQNDPILRDMPDLYQEVRLWQRLDRRMN